MKNDKRMYKFTYSNRSVEAMLKDKDAFWDPALEQELVPILNQLKKTGEVSWASCGRIPGVTEVVYKLEGNNFVISYTVFTKTKEIRFYDFKQISHSIDWENSLEQDINENIDNLPYIPQIGDPYKFLRGIDLIHNKINTPKQLGIAFESKAKKDKDIARRGYYIGRPLEEFGLVQAVGDKNEPCFYELSPKGEKIANSADQETRERLLLEALLGFQPIQIILGKTSRGNEELTKSLIEDVISKVTLDSCGGSTNPRRASSIRALVNWVSRWAGIPILRQGHEGIQLYIPYIYSEASNRK